MELRQETESKTAKASKQAKRSEIRATLVNLAEKATLAFVGGLGAAAGGHALTMLTRRPAAEIVPLRKSV